MPARSATSSRLPTATAPRVPVCFRARSLKRYGHEGLPEDTIWLSLKGTAGQSFGALGLPAA